MEYLKKAATRPTEEMVERGQRVAGIIRDIRQNGDHAVVEYNIRFDSNDRTQLRVSKEEIAAAYQQMDPQDVNDLTEAADHIRRFAQAQKACVL